MGKVEIKNITDTSVTLLAPDMRLKRDILAGGTIKIDQEVIEEAMTFHGVSQLFEQQLLAIVDKKDRELLADAGIKVDVDKVEIYDEKEILAIIEEGTDLELKKLLDTASKSRQDMIASLAVYKAKNLSFGKAALIKKITGTDVAKAKENQEAPDDEPEVKMNSR